jgi:hypothetical protein
MKNVNYQDAKDVSQFPKLVPGGYVCRITNVKDVPDKEYLQVEYDIATGEFANHFLNLANSFGWWAGNFIRSYKEKALPFFKGFISSVEDSNAGFKFNYNETKLVGKMIGLVLAEEEYINQNGESRTRMYVSSVHSVQDIKNNAFKVPEKKVLSSKNVSVTNIPEAVAPVEAIDEECPF